MVKILELIYPAYSDPWAVFMEHYGADGYNPKIYPRDTETGLYLPPWPPDMVVTEGHDLWTPSQWWLGVYWGTIRWFDEFRNLEEGETPVSNEDAAWDFFYEILGHPYRMISRCRYCFPYGHRYLTI